MFRETAALFAVFAAFVAASAGFRLSALDPLAEQRRHSTKLDEDVLRSPGYDAMQIVSMEHQHAVADLFWLQVVQELGRPIEGEQASYDRLQRWSHIAVDLDPKYYTVYWAAAINLISYARRAKAAEGLLLKGREALPLIWELPFFLGYLNYFLRGDPMIAAEWWHEAALTPGAPRFLPSLSARARIHSGDEAGAEELLLSMMDTLEGPSREDAELRLKVIYSERVLHQYDAACLKFLAERGRRPVDGAELHREQYVTPPPFDDFNEPILIDESCRARTTVIKVRDDEALKNVGREGVSPEDDE
jgi:hypothetical protein